MWSPGGGTVLLRQELAQVLALLAPGGLPQLSPLVLLLAACREGWEEPARAALGALLQDLDALAAGDDFPEVRPRLEATLAELGRVVAPLPEALRRGPRAKALLAQAVLEGAPRQVGPKVAEVVVQALEAGEGLGGLSGAGFAPGLLEALSEELELLVERLRPLDPERLAARIRTGLDLPPERAPVELPPSELARRLLQGLADDAELGGLSRVARQLLACVRLPRALPSPAFQGLGGVSDLSNRGPLDRLLISELAWDDLVLAARVATGEALYLRREPPQEPPTRRRLVLIDDGVRLWGAGRVFALAVALALCAEDGAEADVVRPDGAELRELDLLTREGLTAHLARLDASPHPGPALPAFLRRLEQGGQALDGVVITSAAAAADPDVRPLLAAPPRAFFLATVAADGCYRLERCSAAGRRLLTQARLELATLLAPAPPPAAAPELPSAWLQRPFPLLLPSRPRPGRTRLHPRWGAVSITPRGRLLHWAQPGWGARQHLTELPAGELVWLDVQDDGRVRGVVAQPGRSCTLVDYDLERSRLVLRHDLPLPSTPGRFPVVALGEVVVLFADLRAPRVVSLANGAVLPAAPPPPGWRWRSGRFFSRIEHDRAGEWGALDWDGQRLRIEPLPQRDLRPLLVWERPGAEEPWVFTVDGRVGPLSRPGWVVWEEDPQRIQGEPTMIIHKGGVTHAKHQPSGLPDLAGAEAQVSSDGSRVHLAKDGLQLSLNVDAALLSRLPRSAMAALVLEPGLLPFRRLSQPRRRFRGVGLDGEGRLTLLSSRQRWASITTGWAGVVLKIGARDSGAIRLLRMFQPLPPPHSERLALARWQDGSRAWLDSRGLLHLRSSDPALPELTLLLLDSGPMAIWSSDGRVCGPEPFLGRPEGTLPSAEVGQLLARFQERLR